MSLVYYQKLSCFILFDEWWDFEKIGSAYDRLVATVLNVVLALFDTAVVPVRRLTDCGAYFSYISKDA